MTMRKGSFTIEAVILIPLILGMLFQVLSLGIGFYERSMDEKVSKEFENWDSVSKFYQFSLLKELQTSD